MPTFKDDLKREIDETTAQHLLSDSYKKKKLVIFSVRTIIAVILYAVFWNYSWVRWTLVLYIPLAVFNLVALLSFNYLANKRSTKLKSRVGE